MPHEPDFPSDLRALEREYELIRELGQGGMAAVYLARHRTTGQLAAIKAIRARYLDDHDALQRFAREARTVAGLDHPNIVRTHAIEQIDDRAIAIIMEHIGGGTVRDRLREYGSLGSEQAESILRDVASALRYAHQRGIVHRDVKPENIFLDPERGRALLSDFGIARHIEGDTDITLLGAALGTPQYMSPEQIDGEMVDGRSDIYSLGVLGWELLTGRRPWAGESLYGVIYKQKHEELPRITSLRPRVPANLLFAIEGALVKDKTRRWQSVDEFLHQLTYNPPPVLSQSFPAGASPPADEPTLRFRRQELERQELERQELEPAAGHADAAGRKSTLVPVATGAALLSPSIGSPANGVAVDSSDQHDIAQYTISEHAVADRGADVAMLAGTGYELAGTGYELPEFDVASDSDVETGFARGRLGRAMALLVPLAIAGVSLFVVLGGRPSQSARDRSGSGVLTSSSGSIAADMKAVDAGNPPLTVSALEHGAPPAGSPSAATSRDAADHSRDVVEAATTQAGHPSRAAAESSTPLGARRGATRGPAPVAPVAGAENAADARSARTGGADPLGTDSSPATRAADAPILEDPFRPPTSTPASPPSSVAGAVPAPGTGSGGSGTAAATVLPSPRCRLAAFADQQACLGAYIANGDAAMNRAFDALVSELRRVSGVSSGAPDPSPVTRVRVEQRAWLSVRDAECPRQPAAGTEPFWAAPQSECFTEMAASRARELQEAVRRLRRK